MGNFKVTHMNSIVPIISSPPRNPRDIDVQPIKDRVFQNARGHSPSVGIAHNQEPYKTAKLGARNCARKYFVAVAVAETFLIGNIAAILLNFQTELFRRARTIYSQVICETMLKFCHTHNELMDISRSCSMHSPQSGKLKSTMERMLCIYVRLKFILKFSEAAKSLLLLMTHTRLTP